MPTSIIHRRRLPAIRLTLPQSSPTTFHKFKELPAELRCLVWELALPGSRIILLEHKRRKDDAISSESGLRIDKLGFRSDSPRPNTFLACREAYETASKFYKPAFSNASGTSVPEIYFDYSKDVLYLGPEYMGPNAVRDGTYQERILNVLEHDLHRRDLSRVKNLAIWFDPLHEGPNSVPEYLGYILSYFDNAESVTIVNKKYCMPGFKDTYPNMHGELKFLDNVVKVADSDITLQGLPIPGSESWILEDIANLEEFREEIRKLPEEHRGSLLVSSNIPSLYSNVITTPHGEELLLQEVREANAQKMWGS